MAAVEEKVSGQVSGQKSKRAEVWQGRIDECRMLKRKLISEWATNVDYRRGKQFLTDSDWDRIQMTFDWSATKAKQAQLFSQVPQVRLTAKSKTYAAGIPTFARKLNDIITRARVGVAMDECLPDCINAAGVGGVIVSYDSRVDERMVPKADPTIAQMMQSALPAPPALAPQPGMEGAEGAGGAPPQAAGLPSAPPPVSPEMVPYRAKTNHRYSVTRISPADLLWPKAFSGSDFDDAPWQGYEGRTQWGDAKHRFHLRDEDKEKIVGADSRTAIDRLTPDTDKQRSDTDPVVEYQEIFYWRYLYHPEEMSFEAIQRMVFVKGLDEPVIDEEWKGQKRTPSGDIIGSCKPPVRFLTLTYLSDEAIPPSDSAIGRPQVDELIRARSLQLRQLETSLPIRWMDTNRIDPLVQANLLRGTWQVIIPTNGDGSRAIGEIARAAYPQDHLRLEEIAKGDLYDSWQVSPTQLGSRSGSAIRSASEANIMQSNFQTRVGYERARTVNFFVGIAEVLAGLACVVNDFTDEERQALSGWDLQNTSNYYFYYVRADATVLLDSAQRLDRLERFINIAAKSGYVNVKPIITEMALLSGLEPDEVIVDPQPPKDEPANISVRGALADLNDPMSLAFLIKTGQAPDLQGIEEAKKLLMAAGGPPAPAQPENPATPEYLPPDHDEFPDWNEANRVNKRAEDGQ